MVLSGVWKRRRHAGLEGWRAGLVGRTDQGPNDCFNYAVRTIVSIKKKPISEECL